MAVSESNMVEFKMAAIIKLSQNEWVRVFLIQHGRIQDSCHHQVESEWMSEGFLCKWWGTNLGKCKWVLRRKKLWWLNPGWQYSRWKNSRWLPSSSWVRMNEFESDWISLSQSQSGVRVVLWVNLREENKVSESNMAEFKMAAIIRLSKNEWVKVFLIQHGRIQDGCHHQIESEWMSGGFIVQMVGTNLGKCEWFLRGKTKMAISDMVEFKMAEFKMAAIIKLSENE